MPNIPVYNAQVDPRGTIDGRSATGNDFGALESQAQGQFADVIEKLSDHMLAVQKQTKLARAVAAANQDLQTYGETLNQGSTDANGAYVPPPDPAQHEKLWNEKVKQVNEQAKGLLGDDQLYAEYETRVMPTVTSQQIQMRKNTIARAKDAALGTADEAINSFTDAAAASQGLAREQAVANAGSTIDTMARAGIITNVDAVKRKEALARNIDIADVKADLRTPEAALKRLQDPTFYTNLHAGERQTYITQAIELMDREAREKQAAQDRADRQADKAEKATQKALGKQADEMLTSGKLTIGWVQEHADVMSEADHRYFLDKLTNPNKPVNREVYTDLRLRHSKGDDVDQEATAAYKAGDINYEMYNGLLKEQADAPARKATWYKDGEAYIKNGFYIDRFSAEPQKRLYADTLDQWRQWADAHPNATADDARKEYKALQQSAGRLDLDSQPASWPMPRNVSGGRMSITRESLKSGWAKVKKEYEAQQIDKTEFDNQSALYARWTSEVQRREAATAADKPGEKK